MFITSRSKGSKRKTVLIIVIRYDTLLIQSCTFFNKVSLYSDMLQISKVLLIKY